MYKIITTFSLLSVFFFLVPLQANAAVTYATWSPSDKSADTTLTGGDLISTKSGTNAWVGVRSTISKTTGKWYWEITMSAFNSPNTAGHLFGVSDSTYNFDANAATGHFSGFQNGQGGYFDCTTTQTFGYGNGTVNDVYGIAMDVDGGTVDVYKNNSLVKNCTALPAGAMYAFWNAYVSGDQATTNFGASVFTYSPPSGYNAGLYSGTVASSTVNRLSKFTTTTQTLGDSLFSDDGSNMTLTAGNLFMQIGSLIDTVTGGTLNFGTTNATSITIGKSGVTTTFPGPLTANGLATFGSNITVPATFGLDTSGAGVLNIGTTTATTINIGGIQAITNILGLFKIPAAYSIDTATAGTLNIGTSTATNIIIGKSGVAVTVPGTITWGKASTTANCNSSASPAVCSAASAGSVAMSTGGSTLVVNTTAVTANSQIFVTEDSSLGTRLGITCNTTTGRVYSINTRTAGSFTIKSSANPATNKACLSYWIIN